MYQPAARTFHAPAASGGALGVALAEWRIGCTTGGAATDFTPRVVPYHPSLRWPLELPLVHWRGG